MHGYARQSTEGHLHAVFVLDRLQYGAVALYVALYIDGADFVLGQIQSADVVGLKLARERVLLFYPQQYRSLNAILLIVKLNEGFAVFHKLELGRIVEEDAMPCHIAPDSLAQAVPSNRVFDPDVLALVGMI